MRPTKTKSRGSKWRAYNCRRAANLAADSRRRLANRLAREAEATARTIYDYEQALPMPVIRTKPPLQIRLRLEVVGYGSHQFTTTWNAYARQWMPSKRRLLDGISELLKRAPEIAS